MAQTDIIALQYDRNSPVWDDIPDEERQELQDAEGERKFDAEHDENRLTNK